MRPTKPKWRCPECGSEQIREVDVERGEGWQCQRCRCYWGYVDGVCAYDFHHTSQEMKQLEGL